MKTYGNVTPYLSKKEDHRRQCFYSDEHARDYDVRLCPHGKLQQIYFPWGSFIGRWDDCGFFARRLARKALKEQ